MKREIYVEIYVALYCSNTRGDCNMTCWLQFDLYIKSLIVILLNHYTVIPALASIYDNSKQEECSPLVPASRAYSKSVHRVFIALFVEYP